MDHSGREQQATFKLSEIRSAFGLSENGFRLYEAAGLMHCERNQDNGYRIATLGEGTRFAGSYALVRAGMSIREVNDSIDKPLEEYVTDLDKLEGHIADKIKTLIAQKDAVETWGRALREYAANPAQITKVSADRIVFLPIHEADLSFKRLELSEQVQHL